MTRYNVHIYREMKLRFDRIEAPTPEAAANIARDKPSEDADDIAPCDGETFSALVDVVGEEDFSGSQVFDFDKPGKPIVVIAVKDGSVQSVHSTVPVTVFIEDWDWPREEPLLMDFESEPMTPEQQLRTRQHGGKPPAVMSGGTGPEQQASEDGGYDLVDALMRYEAGELDGTEMARLFQHLVNNGLAWKLQGHYRRHALDLLAAGKIHLAKGTSDKDRVADKSRFPLGQTVVTARAIDLLRPDEIALGLARHVRGDWGHVSPEDAEANEEALRTGGRLFSAFGDNDRQFWIITEADKSVTTILLPDDY
jgi:hypothetical protein